MPSWQCDGKFDKSFSKSFSFFLHLERIIIIFCYWGKCKCKNYISCSIFTIIELYLAMTTSASESHGNMKKLHYYVFFCLDRDESRVNVIYCRLLYYHLVKLLLKLLIYSLVFMETWVTLGVIVWCVSGADCSTGPACVSSTGAVRSGGKQQRLHQRNHVSVFMSREYVHAPWCDLCNACQIRGFVISTHADKCLRTPLKCCKMQN